MTDMIDWDDDILGESDADEGVIELTDVVDSAKDAQTNDIIELTDIAESDDVIELTDIVQPEQAVPCQTELDLNIVTEDALDIVEDFGPDGDDSLTRDLELEIETPVIAEIDPEIKTQADSYSEKQMAPEPIQVSAEQLESALERVIEKKFADKIESILFEVMENVIEKELASIKKSLQQDLDQIEND
ncbi:MAG: hypothetical protein L3J69_04220 [Desulfobacula sp.]|nr:hypothetical protein [Desulfobacula sp.]